MDRRSLADALEWLDGHWNMEARSAGIAQGTSGREPEVQLARMRELIGLLADPQQAQPVLHLTGTNGKTSVSRMVTSLLAGTGLAVGLYTSPHLEHLNERIQATPFGAGRRQEMDEDDWRDEAADDLEALFAAAEVGEDLDDLDDPDDGAVFAPASTRAETADGFPTLSISDAELAQNLFTLEQLEPLLSGGQRASWFELVTAAAFRWFADQSLDAAVVEVGLGGRWDATNVADGQVAVITNVGLDHTEFLGPTTADIAMEKAGIIKPGATVVIGDPDPAIVGILEGVARQVGAEAVYVKGRDFACESNTTAVGGRLLDIRTPWGTHEGLLVPVHGNHQGTNAAIALTAAEALLGRALGEQVVADGFASVTTPGRLEVMGRQPLVLLDGAHNSHGARALGLALSEELAIDGRRIIVMGTLEGHDPGEFLRALGTDNTSCLIACPAPSPRTLPALRVAEAAAAMGLDAQVATSVDEAVTRAVASAGHDDLVLVTGSLYVVGAARTALRHR